MFISEKDFIKLSSPKISWDDNEYLMKLYYYPGEGYSQSCLYFDFERFVFFYNQNKGRLRIVSGNSFVDKHGDKHLSYYDFAKLILAREGAELFPEVVEMFSLILRFYQLNPSICRKAIHQNKSLKRKIELPKKKKEFDKVKFGKSNCGGSRTKGVGKSKLFKQPDLELMNLLNCKMNEVVALSAKTHSLQLFEEYKSLFIQWEIAAGVRSGYGHFLSRTKEKSLFIKFKNAVEALQR